MKAQPLRPGDKIGIITPSTPAPVRFLERYQRGIQYLKTMGFEVIEGPCSKTEQAYRSGTIQERAEEVNAFLRDPEIRGIISTIGGTNSSSLLPYLDYDAIRNDPKVIMGYSDVTALLLGIYTKTGLTTFYGPAVVPSFGEYPEMLADARQYVDDVVLKGKTAPYELSIPAYWSDLYQDWMNPTAPREMIKNDGWRCLRSGQARGKLIGGNLNTMSGFMASPYFPTLEQLRGAIFFIEDSLKDMALEERLFNMLNIAGVFDVIGGLILGKHEQFNDLGAPFTMEELLLEVIGDRNIPVLANVDIGHTHPMHVFPLGIEVELDADQGKIVFLEDGTL